MPDPSSLRGHLGLNAGNSSQPTSVLIFSSSAG